MKGKSIGRGIDSGTRLEGNREIRWIVASLSRMFFSISFLCLGLWGWLEGDDGPRPLLPKSCGNFELGGEVLLMRPGSCGDVYVISDSRPYVPPSEAQSTEQIAPEGKAHGVHPTFDWGGRGFAGYIFPGNCFDFRFQYTGLHTRDTGHISPDPATGGLWATHISVVNVLNSPPFVNNVLFRISDNLLGLAEASGRVEFDYDSAEFQLGSRTQRGCDLWLRGVLAVHYARVKDRVTADYRGILHPGENTEPFFQSLEVSSYAQKSDTWVIGPRLAMEGSYDVWCHFGIGFRAGIGLLVGRAESSRHTELKIEQQLPDIEQVANRPSNIQLGRETIVTPSYDIRAGINYTFCRKGCFVLVAEVGYELLSYTHLLPTGPLMRIDSGISGIDCQPFNAHGPYLSLLLQF